jgi:hypothetical protein
MMARLRSVVEAMGPEELDRARARLQQAGQNAAQAGDVSALLYECLATVLVLPDPSDGYSPYMITAWCMMPEAAVTVSVASVARDLLGSAEDSGDPLPEELARELVGAHLQALRTLWAFSNQIDATPPEWLQ